MDKNTNKVGHPVAGIVLGIIGIVLALPLPFFFGVIGGAVAGILGLAGIALGFAARKGGRGIGAIVSGALAFLLAIMITVSVISLFTEMKRIANETDQAPLVAQTLKEPSLGAMGMIMNMPKDEADLQTMIDQMEILNQLRSEEPNS